MTKAQTTVAFLAVLAAASPAAAAEKENAFLSDDGKTLAYAPCSEEEAAECVSHSIDCRGDGAFGNGLAIGIIGDEEGGGPSVRQLAKALIDKPWGEAKVIARLGPVSVDLAVQAVTVNTDEMNADWDLTLHSYDQTVLFEALTPDRAADVTLDVAGHTLTLSADKQTAEKLMKFKQACER